MISDHPITGTVLWNPSLLDEKVVKPATTHGKQYGVPDLVLRHSFSVSEIEKFLDSFDRQLKLPKSYYEQLQ